MWPLRSWEDKVNEALARFPPLSLSTNILTYLSKPLSSFPLYLFSPPQSIHPMSHPSISPSFTLSLHHPSFSILISSLSSCSSFEILQNSFRDDITAILLAVQRVTQLLLCPCQPVSSVIHPSVHSGCDDRTYTDDSQPCPEYVFTRDLWKLRRILATCLLHQQKLQDNRKCC